jgi:hypothetical protein
MFEVTSLVTGETSYKQNPFDSFISSMKQL